jgi:FkbM family methyltransferase
VKIARGLAFPDADQFMVDQVKFDGTYQIENLQAGLRHVTNFDCAIDGGAHVGTWSKVMSQRFHRVLAVEPSPDTFEALAWNLQAWNCTNVEAHRVALGDAPGVVHMHLNAEQAKKANTGARYTQPGGDIPVQTIDNWDLPSLGFLKLDIEGSELVALRGAKDTLARCRPIVLFENKWLWSVNHGHPKNAVAKFLTAQGYRLLEQVSRDQIWGPA